MSVLAAMPSVDWPLFLGVCVWWLIAAIAFAAICWKTGAHRAPEDDERRPPAPLIPLDLHRTQRERAAARARRARNRNDRRTA